MKNLFAKIFGRNNHDNSETFDLVESLQITGMLFLVIGCGKEDALCFLLDSGANCSHIDYASFKNKENLLDKVDDTSTVIGLDDIVHEAHSYDLHFGTNMDLTLRVNTLPENNALATLNLGFPVNGILGLDFMQKTKCILDMGKKTALVDFSGIRS